MGLITWADKHTKPEGARSSRYGDVIRRDHCTGTGKVGVDLRIILGHFRSKWLHAYGELHPFQ